MTDRPLPPTTPLERALLDLGPHLAYPAEPSLADGVRRSLVADRASLGATRRGARLGRAGPWRRPALALLAIAVAIAAVLGASPGARTAVARWLDLRGVGLFYTPPRHLQAPAPLGTHLDLGSQLSLAAARRRVPYHIVVPTAAALGAPNAVYVGVAEGDAALASSPLGRQTALVYRAGALLPRIGHTDIGLLLTEVRGDPSIERIFSAKFMRPGSRLGIVSIHGTAGYWLSGPPHVFFYTDPRGFIVTASVRLAGNTLLWARGGLTLRLESALPEQAALRIAASVR